MRRRRNPLDRIVLKYKDSITLSELSWYLQVNKTTVKNWFGYYDIEKWRLKSLPAPGQRGRWYAWPVRDIEKFLSIEINKTEGRELRIIEPLLTIKNIMTATGKADCTVRLWIRDGKLKAFKAGPILVRVQREELERFLDATYDYKVYNSRLTGEQYLY